MNNDNLKIAVYLVLAISILLFYTKDIDLFGKNFYKNIEEITEPDIIDVLVNKKYKLPNDYVPNDLETINVKYANANKLLRKEAKEAFENLSEEALNEGYKIIAVSAYRDYDYQNNLYEEYVTTSGMEYADQCSARAGHSEHQTGLAVDVMGSNNDYNLFADTKEFTWLKDNAYKYGFILRYPENKEKITGFKYEPWHYRYVGKVVADTIYKENLTLEEYYDKYINLN